MNYTVSIASPQQQYIQFKCEFNTDKRTTELKFPAWRPGRYQMADFAKNVNHFQVFAEHGKALPFHKTDKGTWQVENGDEQKFYVQYSYYAAEMNAGSSFLDARQLYVNPVNCCLFNPDQYNESITVQLEIPDSWEVANSLPTNNRKFEAANYDELADSPFICSAELQHATYEVEGVLFHIWFNGPVKPAWNQLMRDFELFTQKQLDKFLEFPVQEYHFFFQILPYKTYHGVEHEKCTVITIGPSYSIFKELYTEFLGVSSHELYHTWNVKSIRPAEMMPYDFTRENYSKMGYIAEGITTYMGDLMLYKSGVFSLRQYIKEMNAQLQRHFDNFGRFNYSVAESSWDTWIDGYERGAPGRKVSIYTEGCLLAFIADVLILRATSNKKNLDEVMKSLYYEFGKKGIGITEKDYQHALENVSGISFQWFFDDYVHGTKAYNALLVDCFEHIGLDLRHEPVDDAAAAQLGVKCSKNDGKTVVRALYPGGPMDLAGIMLDDEILAINGIAVRDDFDRWVAYFDNDEKEVMVQRKGEIVRSIIPQTNRPFFQRYYLVPVENPNKLQIHAFDGWRSAELGDRGHSTIALDA